jgi:trans-aconitate 2-methyltransferase
MLNGVHANLRSGSMAEWNAGQYNRHSSLQAAMAEELLSRLTLKGDERVLDIGCGDGKITAEIAARVPRGFVLGVDPSQNMIAFANEHFATATRSNLRFDVADVRNFAFPEKFDRVVSFNALHWVPEQDAALRSIRAALDDSGQALLRLVPEGNRISLEDVIEEVRHSARWASNFTGFEKPYSHLLPEAYRHLAEQNGFRVIRTNVEDRTWDFQTPEALFSFAEATFVEWTRHLPKSDWPEFISEVFERYRIFAALGPEEAYSFKFYQMEVVLEPE